MHPLQYRYQVTILWTVIYTIGAIICSVFEFPNLSHIMRSYAITHMTDDMMKMYGDARTGDVITPLGKIMRTTTAFFA